MQTAIPRRVVRRGLPRTPKASSDDRSPSASERIYDASVPAYRLEALLCAAEQAALTPTVAAQGHLLPLIELAGEQLMALRRVLWGPTGCP
jgi:hypothetical protein